jgi:hypothetical protein
MCECSSGVLSYKRPARKLGGDTVVSINLLGGTIRQAGDLGSLAGDLGSLAGE